MHRNGESGELRIVETMGSGAALFDFDKDGDLDVYVVQSRTAGPGRASDSVTSRLRRPGDRLYRNDLVVHPTGPAPCASPTSPRAAVSRPAPTELGVAAGDVDNDGWVDLYRTALGPNQLFRNNGDGTFTDVTRESGAGDHRWSVSASFADLDRDGWLDLHVGNYLDYDLEAPAISCFSRTGERDYCGPSAFAAAPDGLYRNRGDGSFADVTAAAGVALEYGPALGVAAFDADADGWTDIYVANDGEPNLLWINRARRNLHERRAARGCGPQRQRQDRGQHGGSTPATSTAMATKTSS